MYTPSALHHWNSGSNIIENLSALVIFWLAKFFFWMAYSNCRSTTSTASLASQMKHSNSIFYFVALNRRFRRLSE